MTMRAAWRGFLAESKGYMSYSRMKFWQKLSFWSRVPGAALRFYGRSGDTATAAKNLLNPFASVRPGCGGHD